MKRGESPALGKGLRSTREMLRAGGYLFLLGPLAFLAWTRWGGDPLTRVAGRALNAIREGDGEALFATTMAEERACSLLTPEKASKAWTILIKPHVESSRLVRKEKPSLSSNQVQATADNRYLDGAGNPWILGTIANKTDDGAAVQAIFPMLMVDAAFDASGHYRSPSLKQVEETVRRRRPALEAAGIPAMFVGARGCMSWDEFEAMCREKAADRTPGKG